VNLIFELTKEVVTESGVTGLAAVRKVNSSLHCKDQPCTFLARTLNVYSVFEIRLVTELVRETSSALSSPCMSVQVRSFLI